MARPWLTLKVKSPFWREVLLAAGARPAAVESEAGGTTYPGQPGSRWLDKDGDTWMFGNDGRMWLLGRLAVPRDPDGLGHAYGPMVPAGDTP